MQQIELSQVRQSLSDVKAAQYQTIKVHKALAAFKRLQLLKALEIKEQMTMKDLSAVLSVTPSTASRHVRELLNNSDLIKTLRIGRNTFVMLSKKEPGEKEPAIGGDV